MHLLTRVLNRPGREHSPLSLSASLLAVVVLVCSGAFASAVADTVSIANGRLDHCSDNEEAYYVADGRDYVGTVNVTIDGTACQKWTSQSPHAHEIDAAGGLRGIGDHNYCRNPNGFARPWCFTSDPDIRYQFCDVGAPCPSNENTKRVSAYPVTGTHFENTTSAVVSLSCFPVPCNIYYTVDGTQPDPSNSTRFAFTPVQLTGNTTLKYMSLFADGTRLYHVAFYTVQPPPPLTGRLSFDPTDQLSYTGPVFVSIGGFASTDSVLYYVNETFMGQYTEPFWLNSSAHVVAVVNGEVFSANYTIAVTVPILALYPPPGVFIGGTAVVVYTASPDRATFYRRMNTTHGNSAWEKMESMRFTIDAVGVTQVSVKAVYFGGVESYVDGVYSIAAATLPVISPSPSHSYTRPVHVVCRDPTGRLLPLRGAGLAGLVKPNSANMDANQETGDEGEEVYNAYFAAPGAYELSCSYYDDVHVVHTTNATVALLSQPLPPPVYSPACADSFPRTPLLLSGRLLPPADNDIAYGGSLARLSLNVSLVEGQSYAKLDSVTATSADAIQYALSPVTPRDGSSVRPYVRVLLTSVSTDPMETPSPGEGCRYAFHPLGERRTSVVAALPLRSASPDCEANRDGELGEHCAPAVARQLARCLHFGTTDLVSSSSVGPFVLLSVTGLDNTLKPLYDEKVMECLQNPSTVAVRDAVSESSGDLVVVTGWRLVFPGGGASASHENASAVAPAGTGLLIEARGFHVERATDYRLVREDYSCDDIGYPARNMPSTVLRGATGAAVMATMAGETLPKVEDRAMATGENRSLSAQSAGTDTVSLLFSVDSPGRYKLCVRIGEWTTYVVPSLYAAAEPILTVMVPPAPTLTAGAASDPCGGLVDVAYAETPISVTFFTQPLWVLSRFFYSFDAQDEWAITNSGATIILPKKVNAYTNPVEVISGTLGTAASGPAEVCVYYAPTLHPPVSLAGLTYSFFKVGNHTRTTLEYPATPSSSESYADGSSGDASSVARGTNSSAAGAPRKLVSGRTDVVIALHGTFQPGERVVLQVYEETGDIVVAGATNGSVPLKLVSSTLATPSALLENATTSALSVPDAPVQLSFSLSSSPLYVRAVLDGSGPVVVEPTVAALSPLSLAMVKCNTCKSGYCYSDFACVCIGAVNRTAYICAEQPQQPEPEMPSTPVSGRLLLLGLYFALLACIGIGFLLAIRRGTVRSKRHATEIVIEEVEDDDADTPEQR